MARSSDGAAVAALTFVAIGVLLILDALEVVDVAVAVVPAVLLIGLGLAILARSRA